jgi:hypothetical protein
MSVEAGAQSLPLSRSVSVSGTGVALTAGPPAGCKGDLQNPGAEKGHMCVFAGEERNLIGLSGGVFHAINPEGEGIAAYGTVGKSGTILFGQAENAEAVFAFGTWAVSEE